MTNTRHIAQSKIVIFIGAMLLCVSMFVFTKQAYAAPTNDDVGGQSYNSCASSYGTSVYTTPVSSILDDGVYRYRIFYISAVTPSSTPQICDSVIGSSVGGYQTIDFFRIGEESDTGKPLSTFNKGGTNDRPIGAELGVPSRPYTNNGDWMNGGDCWGGRYSGSPPLWLSSAGANATNATSGLANSYYWPVYQGGACRSAANINDGGIMSINGQKIFCIGMGQGTMSDFTAAGQPLKNCGGDVVSGTNPPISKGSIGRVSPSPYRSGAGQAFIRDNCPINSSDTNANFPNYRRTLFCLNQDFAWYEDFIGPGRDIGAILGRDANGFLNSPAQIRIRLKNTIGGGDQGVYLLMKYKKPANPITGLTLTCPVSGSKVVPVSINGGRGNYSVDASGSVTGTGAALTATTPTQTIAANGTANYTFNSYDSTKTVRFTAVAYDPGRTTTIGSNYIDCVGQTPTQKPYFKLFGGDVTAGGYWPAPAPTTFLSSGPQKMGSIFGNTYIDPATGNWYGSSTQYAAYAVGDIKNFFSSNVFQPGRGNYLTFSNTGGNFSDRNYFAINDFYNGTVNDLIPKSKASPTDNNCYGGIFKNKTSDTAVALNVNRITEGLAAFANADTVDAPQAKPSIQCLNYYVRVNLSGKSWLDLSASGDGNTALVQRIFVVVDGGNAYVNSNLPVNFHRLGVNRVYNIYVDNDVTYLDGDFSARVIYSCYDNGNRRGFSKSELASQCNKQLIIHNGLWAAERIRFLRTYGDAKDIAGSYQEYQYDPSNVTSTSRTKAAEVFDTIQQPFPIPAVGVYDSITELPAVF